MIATVDQRGKRVKKEIQQLVVQDLVNSENRLTRLNLLFGLPRQSSVVLEKGDRFLSDLLDDLVMISSDVVGWKSKISHIELRLRPRVKILMLKNWSEKTKYHVGLGKKKSARGEKVKK